MLGSTFATADVSSVNGGFTELADVTAHAVTLQLQNNDQFGSQYGYRGTDYDYRCLIRNSYESPKVGFPRMSRHNAEFQLTKRATVTSGITTAAIPYFAGLTLRLPETGSATLLVGAAAAMLFTLLATSGQKLTKMTNFES